MRITSGQVASTIFRPFSPAILKISGEAPCAEIFRPFSPAILKISGEAPCAEIIMVPLFILSIEDD